MNALTPFSGYNIIGRLTERVSGLQKNCSNYSQLSLFGNDLIGRNSNAIYLKTKCSAFSDLTLLVEQQEGHPARKNRG